MLTRVLFGKDTFQRSHFVKGAHEGGFFEELGLEVTWSGGGL
jgi:hypothetical protein